MDNVELKTRNDRLPAAVKEAKRLITGFDLVHKMRFVLALAAIVLTVIPTGLVASGAMAVVTVVITMAYCTCIVLLLLSFSNAAQQEMISPMDLYRVHRDVRTDELRKIFMMLQDWETDVEAYEQQVPETSEAVEMLVLLKERSANMDEIMKHAERLMAKGPLGTVRTVDHDDIRRIEMHKRQQEAREFTKEIEFRNQSDDFIRRIEERNETKKLG